MTVAKSNPCGHCGTQLVRDYITADTFADNRVMSKGLHLVTCPRCDDAEDRDESLLPALGNHQSLRCRYCETRWPAQERYASCPLCREPTHGTGFPSLPLDEAEARAVQHEFGWFLWDRGAV